MEIIVVSRKVSTTGLIVAILVFMSSIVNHVLLGFSVYDAALISMVFVTGIFLGSAYVVKLCKPCNIGINIGGFIIPLAYSLITLYLTYRKTPFPMHVFFIDLIILSIVFYLVSIHIAGYGIGLSIIPTTLLISSTTLISFGCNSVACIPLSSVLGYLSIIFGVDILKTMEISLRRKIEFILGGAGINDIVVATGALTPFVTLLLLIITTIR